MLGFGCQLFPGDRSPVQRTSPVHLIPGSLDFQLDIGVTCQYSNMGKSVVISPGVLIHQNLDLVIQAIRAIS